VIPTAEAVVRSLGFTAMKHESLVTVRGEEAEQVAVSIVRARRPRRQPRVLTYQACEPIRESTYRLRLRAVNASSRQAVCGKCLAAMVKVSQTVADAALDPGMAAVASLQVGDWPVWRNRLAT